jgi:hypothetical protein
MRCAIFTRGGLAQRRLCRRRSTGRIRSKFAGPHESFVSLNRFETFNLSAKEARIAQATGAAPIPTLEQIRHFIQHMTATTDIEQRYRQNRSLPPSFRSAMTPGAAVADWVTYLGFDTLWSLDDLLFLRPIKPNLRAVWVFVHAGKIDATRLVFVDETRLKTNMAPHRGWGPRNRRLPTKVPYEHWKTMTFIAGPRLDRVSAPWIIDGPINGELFRFNNASWWGLSRAAYRGAT